MFEGGVAAGGIEYTSGGYQNVPTALEVQLDGQSDIITIIGYFPSVEIRTYELP